MAKLQTKGNSLEANRSPKTKKESHPGQTYSIAGGQHSVSAAAHRSELQESALHYGGGMTAALVLQSMVMLAQVGLGIYGIIQVVRLQQEGEAYLCSDSINVFWVLMGLHFIQNTCVLGKLGKGSVSGTFRGPFCSVLSFLFSEACSTILAVPTRTWGKATSGPGGTQPRRRGPG